MSFEAAKCPNCGGAIQVPSERETANCMYYGSSLRVKDAIEKLRIELSGNVSVTGISSVENDLERGKQGLFAKDWESAYNIFCGAVNKQANSFEAWWGCLNAMTQKFTWIDYTWVKLDGISGLESVIQNCIAYSNQIQKREVVININTYLGVRPALWIKLPS